MLRSEAKPLNPMLAQASSSTSITPWLRKRIKRIADSNPYLRDELDMLLKRAVDDELMALVRAPDCGNCHLRLCDKNSIKTHDKGNASLNRAIRNLAKTTYATQALVALCDAVRLEGNRCAHCKPGFGKAFKPVRVAPSTLLDTMNRLAEILEVLLLGDDQGYALGLSEPFGSMHRTLRSRWAQYLAHKQEGAFPLLEALESLYRSIIRELTPRLLTVLAKYRDQGTLPHRLHSKEKEALRRLRNLSLISHDGGALFEPTRSTRVGLTPQGYFLLALLEGEPSGREEHLARNVIRAWHAAEQDSRTLKFLNKIQYDTELPPNDKSIARKSRNMYLVRHTSYFLEAADDVSLTDLGYYMLGRHKPD